MATNAHLTGEPECSARDAEDHRRRFQAMLHEAEREADRDGALAVDGVFAELDMIIETGG
jgi:antitoxin ParD1/3/4